MQERWPAKLAIIILLITIFPLSYPVYFLSKIPICFIAAYYCKKNYKKDSEQPKSFWHFLIIAVLFNPFFPLHLFFSALWIIADLIVAYYFYKYQKDLKEIT